MLLTWKIVTAVTEPNGTLKVRTHDSVAKVKNDEVEFGAFHGCGECIWWDNMEMEMVYCTISMSAIVPIGYSRTTAK